MQSSTQNSNPYKEEINYCEHMKYIFEDEGFEMQFAISSALIRFHIKHNEDSLNVFEEILPEFDGFVVDHNLQHKWQPFTCRSLNVQSYNYKYSLVFESIRQDCVDSYSINDINNSMENL